MEVRLPLQADLGRMGRRTPVASQEAHRSSFAVAGGAGSPHPVSAQGSPSVVGSHRCSPAVPDESGAQQALIENVSIPRGCAVVAVVVKAAFGSTAIAVEASLYCDCSAVVAVGSPVPGMPPRTEVALDSSAAHRSTDSAEAAPSESAQVALADSSQMKLHAGALGCRTENATDGVGNSSPAAWSWLVAVSCSLSAHASLFLVMVSQAPVPLQYLE